MALIFTIVGAVTDWLGASAANLSLDEAAKAAKIQTIFDAIDSDPRNTAQVDALVAEMGPGHGTGRVNEAAAREIRRRYREEYIPELRRQQSSAMIQSDISVMERIRSRLATEIRADSAEAAQPAPGTPENNLRLNNIPYRRRASEIIVVGDVDFNNRDLLPDLTGVIVTGGYYIFDVPTKNMYGTPEYVGGNFFCGNNGLETLDGATQEIGGGFNCKDNKLTNLRGGPQQVGDDYIVENNRLETLAGAPPSLSGIFNILQNPVIQDFEHAPKSFRELRSDYGVFRSWDDVPAHLLQSEEKLQRMAQEFNEKVKAVAREAGGLTRDVTAPKTARFSRLPSGRI
ncbi:MAG TPA: hypothetical protein VEF76_00380 [Patescibacteria group bacterium]|nr:hypothetical protein [Patescibacteria group bacterium]